MTRGLLRACLDCKTVVRGKPRCRDCQAARDRAKAAKRPDMRSHTETERRRLVADHRAIVGDWCPGVPELRRPAHQSADLTADHAREVARGGRPDGRLVVRCRSCNAARSAHLAHRALRVLSRVMATDPGAGGVGDSLRDDGQAGPVVA